MQRFRKLFRFTQKANAPKPTRPEDPHKAPGVQATIGLLPDSTLRTGATSLNVPQFVDITSDQGTLTVQITAPETHDSAALALPDYSTESAGEQDTRQPSALKANAKLAWHGFKLIAKNVEAFLDSTPFKIPIAVLNILIDTADDVIDSKESLAELLLPIGQRLEIVSNALKLKQPPKDIHPTLERFARCVLLPSSVG
ncbi:hypothetical protein B0H14DRAFT_3441558 [Mycena olivaceomarginata]|nr:hypothetical protein B0H14DRAFT_3441558 [Mycena olivaceomarginata]